MYIVVPFFYFQIFLEDILLSPNPLLNYYVHYFYFFISMVVLSLVTIISYSANLIFRRIVILLQIKSET